MASGTPCNPQLAKPRHCFSIKERLFFNADLLSVTRSHWMPPPSGECLHHITPAAAKVIDFGCKTQNFHKNYF